MSSLKPISHSDLKDKLRKGTVKFYFRKVGGELRSAIGTLDLNQIPSMAQPKGGRGPAHCTAYYDLERGWWRTISESQEIWVE